MSDSKVIANYFLKTYGATLRQYRDSNNLPNFDAEIAKQVYIEKWQDMYREVCTDVKAANNAFLGFHSMNQTVLRTSTVEYCCRLCKMVYERMEATKVQEVEK
jgi:hypothetical protein